MNKACTIEILPCIFTLQGARNNKSDWDWKQLWLDLRAADPVDFLCEGLCMSLCEWNVWDLESTGIFVSSSFFLVENAVWKHAVDEWVVYACTYLCTCALIWCLLLRVYMYVWDIIQVTYFVSEQIGQSYQTEDRSQLITCDLMYLNILKRLFFLSIKSLIRPPPQQPAACAGKTWINWKWVCSSGEISFFLAGPVPRERFRVTGQPPATHRGWICANHFLHLMGGIARRSGGHPQNSTFWSCEGLRDFSKTFVSLCGENSDEQILLNFNR